MGACKVTNKTAMMSSAATSAMAECTTLRRNTTMREESTSRPASTKNINVETFMGKSLYCAATITIAVIITFTRAAGKSIFQPRRMTWS